jgi:hypothetical protein
MSYSVTRKARTPTHIVLIAQYKKGKAKNIAEHQTEISLEDTTAPEGIKAGTEAQRKRGKSLLKEFKKTLGV